jgi:hypothetical protein
MQKVMAVCKLEIIYQVNFPAGAGCAATELGYPSDLKLNKTGKYVIYWIYCSGTGRRCKPNGIYPNGILLPVLEAIFKHPRSTQGALAPSTNNEHKYLLAPSGGGGASVHLMRPQAQNMIQQLGCISWYQCSRTSKFRNDKVVVYSNTILLVHAPLQE